MVIGFDTETFPITRHCLAPKLVCLSLASAGDPPYWALEADDCTIQRANADEPGWRAVYGRESIPGLLPHLFDRDTTLVGHNTEYDLTVLANDFGVIDQVFEAIDDCRVYDTKIRELLLRLANGEFEFFAHPMGGIRKTTYDMAALVDRYFGIDISADKADPNGWRLRYRELDGVPVANWPIEAVNYAALDAYWPLLIAEQQIAQNPQFSGGHLVHDGEAGVTSEFREVAAALALHLQAVWGLRTEAEASRATFGEWLRIANEGIALGQANGFVRVKGRDKGKPGTLVQARLRDLVSEAYGGRPPMTDPSKKFPDGQVKLDTETLTNSGSELLSEYGDTLQAKNWQAKYTEGLVAGINGPLCSHPNVLVATGRTSWADPPLHQPPRKGGYRGCFVPRPGWLYVAADFDAAELVSISQVCLWVVGWSRLADTINAGKDPHLVTMLKNMELSRIEGRPQDYEEAKHRKKIGDKLVIEGRQAAKAINFGFLGMMGIDTFRAWSWATYRVRMTDTQARQGKEAWFDEYPEMQSYFRFVTDEIEGGSVKQFVSNRVRGDVRAPAAANGYFQGLTADGAKYGVTLLSQAAYTGKGPPPIAEACKIFHGCRPALFLHDEQLSEVPEDIASEAAEAQAKIMVWAMEQHIPDVKVVAKPVLMRRWLKGADPTYVDGKLTVTEAK